MSRILIIDDDLNISKFLNESLKLKGYQAEAFNAAEPALEDDFAGRGYGDFKKALAEVIVSEFGPVRARCPMRMRPTTFVPGPRLTSSPISRVS